MFSSYSVSPNDSAEERESLSSSCGGRLMALTVHCSSFLPLPLSFDLDFYSYTFCVCCSLMLSRSFWCSRDPASGRKFMWSLLMTN